MKRRIFILGAHGRLGTALYRSWKKEAASLAIEEVIPLGHKEIDFSNPDKAAATFAQQSLQAGDIIVNTAAMADVDACECEQELAMRVNAITPRLLAKYAAEHEARLIHLSTDYVFDGKGTRPYTENDTPAPLSHYGASKLEAENAVLTASSHHIVVRVSWLFGPDRPSFIDQIIQQALTATEVAAVHDKISSPCYTEDLADWLTAFFDLSVPGGIYHLCNSGICSWRDYGEYALQTAKRHGINVLTTSVAPLKMTEVARFVAARPQFTPLDTTKFSKTTGLKLRSWQEAVEAYLGDRSRLAAPIE
ncbi:MAG: dTDP-4-dehydrorhamnose reductase [Chthoniobacterales bacterium]